MHMNLRLWLVSASLLLAACGSGNDGATDPPPPQLAGSYTLTAVDGKPLPVTLTNTVITGGQLTVTSAGSWNETRMVTDAPKVTIYGTWTAAGDAYRFMVGSSLYYLAQPSAGGVVLSEGTTKFTFARN